MNSSEIMHNTEISYQKNYPKYTKISERERERLYEECFGEVPYIGYYDTEEISERQKINKEKSKPVIVTYETSKRISKTLIKTSEECGSAEVYGKMATFYIPQHIFDEKVESQKIEEIQ